MKKKGLSLLLASMMLVGSFPISVWAEFEITTSESQNFEVAEDGTQAVMLTKDGVEPAPSDDYEYDSETDNNGYQWYSIKVDSDGFVTDEIVLKMDDVWYFSTDQIEYYTDYVFDEEDMCFREDAEIKSGGLSKAIAIDTSNNTAFVRAYLQRLDNIYEYNGQLYYPIHQILPLMECGCGADGDVLYLENAEVSMVDALGTYVPEVIYYDAAEEFAGNKWANLIMVGSAYLFDTVGHADNWTRLLGAANYVDYRAAAKDYLTQYEVYQDVMAYKNELTDMAKEGKKDKKESESLMNKYKFLEMIHDMLEAVGNESDFYNFIPEDIWKEISGWAKAADISGKALEAVTDYVLMVKDHRDMLGAVYPKIENDVKFTDQKYRGIKSIYDAYGGSMLHAILAETVDGLKEEGVWFVIEKGVELVTKADLGLYKLVADVGGNIMTAYVEQLGIKASDAMALLNHHIIFTNEAKEKYHKLLQEGAYTQEKAEDIRLAALMTMVSSKRCFEIIRDNNALDEEISSYCNNRIAQIDEVLKKIYLAKDAIMVDGIEYFKNAPEMFAVQLTNLRGVESGPTEPLSELEYYFRENYSKSDNMWLLDVVGNDEIEELLVVTAPDENDIIYFRIYTTYDTEISIIFEESAGVVPGERKAMYLMEDGYGNYAFLYFYPRTLQGYNTAIDVFALETYGGYIYLRSESVKWESEEQEVLNDVVSQFHSLNPYWIELFNTLIGFEEERMQNALDYAGVTLGLSNNAANAMSASERLEQYYATFFTENDKKWMLDVTGDGEPELLVLTEADEIYYFYVYMARGSSVVSIYTDAADWSHAGQRALYLIDNMDGSYSFLSYVPSTWQDYRSIYGEWFRLDSDGYMVSWDAVYTDQDQDMYNEVYQFVSRIYPFLTNAQVIFDTVPESERMEWDNALSAFTENEILIGTPVEDSELNNTFGNVEDWNSNTGYQMPEDIFWMIEDAFGSFQMRFRNESDGCYIDLTDPDGFVYSTPCILDVGAGTDIYIDDQLLLQQYVMNFSQDFTGGGYSITYNSETRQIYVVTMNGQWIELYFFDH